MRPLPVLLLATLLLTPVATAQGFYGVNGSEPSFLSDIGPQDDRSDNPLAAGLVAVAVAVVVAGGLRRYEG